MVVKNRLISAEEFWELAHDPQYDDKRLELVEGIIIEMPKSGGQHGEIVGEITLLIGVFVKQHKLGRFAPESGFILQKGEHDTIRSPDFAFVSFETSPDPLPVGLVPFAPDLAVEVVSPNNSASEIHTKVRTFLQAGTQIVWVVYPETQTVVVHTNAGAKTFEATDVIDGGAVLPGFQLNVADIFPSKIE